MLSSSDSDFFAESSLSKWKRKTRKAPFMVPGKFKCSQGVMNCYLVKLLIIRRRFECIGINLRCWSV